MDAETKDRPVILWLLDVPGWAYGAIYATESRRLPQYQHVPWYVVGQGWMAPNGAIISTLRRLMEEADIIVCMYVEYQRLVKDKSKIALMVTGWRPFECQA